jgi:hypothetical protein
MLLGCEFYPHGWARPPEPVSVSGPRWWVHGGDGPDEHPLEQPRSEGWPSKATLAREYIEYTLENPKWCLK